MFLPLYGIDILVAPSRVLCLAASVGHTVDDFHAAGTRDTTWDLIDFPPLVHRVDPHDLPFSDSAFDLVFSDDLSVTSDLLFPSRLAREAEHVVRRGGGIALMLDREVEDVVVATLFKGSRVVDVKDVILDGS